MTAKEHYENHLANFYSWMTGDLTSKSNEFKKFLQSNQIAPHKSRVAIDLGAGNGVQSIALQELAYEVTAIDFNKQLLDELKSNPNSEGITTIQTDILNVKVYEDLKPELIVCCGDTITHLDSKKQIEYLLDNLNKVLITEGKLILSYRDYSNELPEKHRFIPVKSTEERILTCILEYHPDKVKVSDLLYEKLNGQWSQKVSTYEKVRISTSEIIRILEKNKMIIKLSETVNGMQMIVAQKIKE